MRRRAIPEKLAYIESMNDMTQTPALEYQAKQRKRAEGLDNNELASLVSRSMMRVEQALDVATERLCKAAGDDRTGKAAMAMNTTLRALRTIQAAHCDLSEAQTMMIDAPIALRNER